MKNEISLLADKFAAQNPGRYSVIDDTESEDNPSTKEYSTISNDELSESPMMLPPPLPPSLSPGLKRHQTMPSMSSSELTGNVAFAKRVNRIKSMVMDIEDENKRGNYLVAQDLANQLGVLVKGLSSFLEYRANL